MLGYDMGENGEWVINEKQANIVREIYSMYLCGISAHRIARFLNENALYTVNGNQWFAKTVIEILRNEKYVGDLEMQKTITVDMLSHTSKKNDGEAKKYYIKDHHPAIVDRQTWENVQKLLNGNTYSETRTKVCDKFAVLSNLVCGVCGRQFKRVKYSSKAHSLSTADAEYYFSFPLLKCEMNTKNCMADKKLKRGEKRCNSEYLYECAVQQSFMEKLYQMKSDIVHNGDKAKIIKDYYQACVDKAKNENSVYYNHYTDILDSIDEVYQILEKTINSQKEMTVLLGENDIFNDLIKEYQKQLTEIEDKKNLIVIQMVNANESKPVFDYFIKCLLSLPDTDPFGNTLNIYNKQMTGGNTNGLNNVFDLLTFNKAFYLSFIESGTVYGDVIEYKTKFGVTFRTEENLRKMEDFVGFRKYDENGNYMIITQPYQVVGTKLQYRKKCRKNPNAQNKKDSQEGL